MAVVCLLIFLVTLVVAALETTKTIAPITGGDASPILMTCVVFGVLCIISVVLWLAPRERLPTLSHDAADSEMDSMPGSA